MRKILTIAAGAALLGIVVATPASANIINSNATATSSVQAGDHISLRGTVTAISSSTLAVLVEGKSWTVNLANGFLVRTRNVLKVALSRVKIGDSVIVKGTV